MKRILLATAAGLALTCAASAADLPVKARPFAPAPAFSWTGCYIGAHVGAGSLEGSVADYSSIFYYDSVTDRTGVGAIAGGQIGCNYQVGMLVLGIEGEGAWSGVKRTSELSYDDYTYSAELKSKYTYDVAARIGVAFDRALVYGKLGWAWGKFDYASSYGYAGLTSRDGSASATLNGVLLGLGLEYALTGNWTVKAEYNYLNFGADTLDITYCDSGVCAGGYRSTLDATQHIGKIGVNYKFDWGAAPVLAKY
ncbi:outer membrane beta-barrel protein [Rhodoplanes sp. TEM]|uniref:Outer membrane beta-barrel protein n=1 Tax=Rhodoplanes tepidamans TaxID=200616 RepID=A0ABT5JHV1_RHOTP|nr:MULTISPECIES: outer membrane beta-barrel protein [Rhodoplanes]MDC7788869.1 outer membrane beta-barrel protein [Rhodoplanes tepidamans]MDC7987949.1 outer membrane beta-barrel protein [Rhodoplanes sp. TEM]MDQ0355105.1 outer membrane immunogenic protein [Rhodoplanes tepidamans]